MEDNCVRKLKQTIPTCNILGVRLAAVNMEWLRRFTKDHLGKLSGEYMCVSNVHTTVMSYENREYCQIQNDSILSIPDGAPLSIIGRMRGYSQMQRTTGPDYMGEVFAVSAEKGYRHFFYGSTQETLDLLQRKLKEKYPGIEIVGVYSPPFRALTEEEDQEVIQMIADAAPDFVWIGLGAPKQEIWMSTHKGKIPGFMVGVGAGFDYYAGNIKRAPKWMQKFCLEWMYRLMQDPRKLLKRYFSTNGKFIWLILRGKG